jgi:hypothetical protein
MNETNPKIPAMAAKYITAMAEPNPKSRSRLMVMLINSITWLSVRTM